MGVLKYAKTGLAVLFLVVSYSTLYGQLTTSPVQKNPSIHQFLEHNPNYTFQPKFKNKFGRGDTLELPFFDDFSERNLYPDSLKWLNNQVYVNNHFPYQPPTINVATFDGLDSKGNPYRNTINKDFSGPGDSLISQHINLKDSSGFLHAISDSIVFSFFYQPNGLGYHLNSEDSLRLWFKAANNLWVQVWSVGGQAVTTKFNHVSIPILDNNYLHKGFQFMFTTYTRQVGNANHWHLDYVLLDKDRSSIDDSYNDYAIQNTPSPLLNYYTQMPYSHFSVNPNDYIVDSVYLRLSNLYKEPKTLQIRHQASINGSLIASTEFENSTKNIDVKASAVRNLPPYSSFIGLSSEDPIIINRMVEVRENGVVNDYKRNDSISFTQEFSDFYAYDDGTVEQGFGFDQNTNPSNIRGQVAYGFDIAKEDTLYAIATYFNQAVYDVSRKRFNYRIWKDLSGVNTATEDDIIYESEELLPTYSSVNNWRTFTPHYLDTTLILSPGRYYIGWIQQSMFNLNVGWDKNYGYSNNPDKINRNIYYRTFGNWTNNDLPTGTLMMRPHFGTPKEIYASVSRIDLGNYSIKIYPNPANDIVYLPRVFSHIRICELNGKQVLEFWNNSNLNVSSLKEGAYFVFLNDNLKRFYTAKLIIHNK
ncbi:MAG: T9SS type A sorting domain-containing protein [Bacteroidia bacterium]|nr:T9SS type A sorting domain-containing protein [Bacteroidia bacterium]